MLTVSIHVFRNAHSALGNEFLDETPGFSKRGSKHERGGDAGLVCPLGNLVMLTAMHLIFLSGLVIIQEI